MTKNLALGLDKKTFYIVISDQRRLTVVQPNKSIFESNICLVGTDIYHITPNNEIQILFKSIGKQFKPLTVRKIIPIAA